MAFRFEADLAEPLCAWLRAAGFCVRVEVPIVRRRADLFAWRGENVTAIEMKLHDWAEALHQAVAYQLAADWTWVAMPLGQRREPIANDGVSRRNAWACLRSTSEGRSALTFPPDSITGHFRS